MLPEIKTILYCTDASENSASVCRHALYLAKKTGARIHILHVAEKLSQDALITLESYLKDFKGADRFNAERKQRTRELLQQRLDALWEQMDEEDKHLRDQIASVKVVEAYPVDAILKQAEDLDCDLIVMGTHQKGVRHTFLGSVSKRVLDSTHVPVMVVPLPRD